MYVCLGENKNNQLETLSVYRRTLLGVCGVCPLRQKILRTALKFSTAMKLNIVYLINDLSSCFR